MTLANDNEEIQEGKREADSLIDSTQVAPEEILVNQSLVKKDKPCILV